MALPAGTPGLNNGRTVPRAPASAVSLPCSGLSTARPGRGWRWMDPGRHQPLTRSCAAASASARGWISCWTECARVRAGCWSCAARQESARPRCWTISWRARVGVPHRARAAGVESEMELAFAGSASALRADARPAGATARPAARCARHGVRPECRRQRRTAFSSVWPCSACCPRSPRSSRSSASSTTRSGSIGLSAQTLAFVARRLLAESVALGVRGARAERRGGAGRASGAGRRTGLSDARCPRAAGLGDPGRLDERGAGPDRRRDARQPARVAGAAPGVDDGGAGRRVRASRRAAAGEPDRAELSAAARVASGRDAATCCSRRRPKPVGDVDLLWRAAERLGIGADAAAPAEAAGLIEVGARVRFRHPLVRSAVYRAATVPDRQAVHRGAGRGDRSRRRSRSARVASCPRRGRARRGGGRRAGALGRPGARPRRRRGGGRVPGAGDRADARSGPARRRGRWPRRRPSSRPARPMPRTSCSRWRRRCPLDELQRARLARLRAQIVFARRRGSDAPPLLLEAAEAARTARRRLGA